MKYKVYVYKATPESLTATQLLDQNLTYENPAPSCAEEFAFDNRDALYHHVRRFDYTGLGGEQRNYFLEATITHPNDSRRHKIFLNKRSRIFYLRGYLVKGEHGRTVDLRNYETELYKFNDDEYRRLLQIKLNEDFEKRLLHRETGRTDWYAEMKTLYGIGWQHWCSLRGFRTLQERRQNSDPVYKSYVRGKRRKLSEPWGTEIPISRRRSWKDRRRSISMGDTFKFKRQWQVNLSHHVDTVRFDKKAYAHVLNEVDCTGCFDE